MTTINGIEQNDRRAVSTEEIWKDVPGFEGCYQVSDQGRVKSVARLFQRAYGKRGDRRIISVPIKERVLSPGDAGGYVFVFLHRRGSSKKMSVHHLVLEVFVSPRPGKLEGCHNDGNYKNNRVDNLRWDTHKGNHQDRIRHGTNNAGVKNGSAKITEEIVREIRDLYRRGVMSQYKLADRFGISQGQVGRITRYELWKDVGD